MSSGLPSASEGPPTVFQRPTLGCAVRLGELFDERTSHFLGVQLYKETPAKPSVTRIYNSDLTLELSNSLEKKTRLLDIQGNLSLEILSGLVKVEGSASYLNNAKNNTQARSWTLVLKMKTEEHRLLFAEDGLSTNVLDMVKRDYIAENRATHFVSSIVYGGNLFINMTERATEVTKEESIEGKLGLELERLKGSISLKGEARAKAKAGFDSVKSKFDLVVHGDVELESVPVEATDVFDVIPRAKDHLLGDPGNGAPKGVPISVTLQPIPKSILNDSQAISVYRINQSLINKVLETFSQLEDVRNRIRVLVDRTGVYKNFIPQLAKRVLDFSDDFSGACVDLLLKLSQFLRDMMTTGKSDVDMSTDLEAREDQGRPGGAASGEDSEEQFTNSGPKDVREGRFTGFERRVNRSSGMPPTKDQSVLYQARSLLQAPSTILHQTLAKDSHHAQDNHADGQAVDGHDGRIPREKRIKLLEDAVLEFQRFIRDVRGVPAGAAVNGKAPPSNLSTLADVRRAPRSQSTIHLFLMTSFKKYGDDPVSRFLALLRRYKDGDSKSRCLLYVEDRSVLTAKLPNGKEFSELQTPSYYVGSVTDTGVLSWRLIAPDSNGKYP
ncbi:hypothetical protein PISMIDRAFT_688545 [Pisolithus microcarpus 441]|uniref:SNTX MACPF/CDC-like domain-containing protein n=1 Tax=Pisolithus microcarpus 441 TaxID=765257 RepID=A0A0C9Y9M9_9AGAM|nr:hypothetical protein BKA83DRAFT_688545 [Pisolithus microcarpus]KIK13581.1 hypothetical protein PISMIDRAFT_688545 [Pisolithus microcarpus 441]